jgi:hypothetical protein
MSCSAWRDEHSRGWAAGNGNEQLASAPLLEARKRVPPLPSDCSPGYPRGFRAILLSMAEVSLAYPGSAVEATARGQERGIRPSGQKGAGSRRSRRSWDSCAHDRAAAMLQRCCAVSLQRWTLGRSALWSGGADGALPAASVSSQQLKPQFGAQCWGRGSWECTVRAALQMARSWECTVTARAALQTFVSFCRTPGT